MGGIRGLTEPEINIGKKRFSITTAAAASLFPPAKTVLSIRSYPEPYGCLLLYLERSSYLFPAMAYLSGMT